MTDLTDLTADFNSDPIEGYARAAMEAGGNWDAAYFSVPLISHITDRLYVGGWREGVDLGDRFPTVVSLYRPYLVAPSVRLVQVSMWDAGWIDKDLLDAAAQAVLDGLTQGPTLVHCQAGLNRSNLVAARALMWLGRTADEAIGLLREKRSPLVLCNQAFEDYLRGQR